MSYEILTPDKVNPVALSIAILSKRFYINYQF